MPRQLKTVSLVLLGAALLCGPMVQATATTLPATPETAAKVIAQAKGGDTVVLAPGTYREVNLSRQTFTPELTIDARAASIEGWTLSAMAGITFQGGTYRLSSPKTNAKTGATSFGSALRLNNVQRIQVTDATFIGPGAAEHKADAPYGDGYGLFALGGSQLEVRKSRFQGFKSGLVMTQVERFKIAQNSFRWMRSDGIQVSKSRKGLIEGNVCRDTRTRADEHPDCIQMWSLPPFPPTADVVIRGNDALGPTQGIGLFNHVRAGVDDGGFDRITIEDNTINVSRPNGITILDGRDSIVRNNSVKTGEGARFQARIRVVGSVRRCGNTVEPGAGKPGVVDPKC